MPLDKLHHCSWAQVLLWYGKDLYNRKSRFLGLLITMVFNDQSIYSS